MRPARHNGALDHRTIPISAVRVTDWSQHHRHFTHAARDSWLARQLFPRSLPAKLRSRSPRMSKSRMRGTPCTLHRSMKPTGRSCEIRARGSRPSTATTTSSVGPRSSRNAHAHALAHALALALPSPGISNCRDLSSCEVSGDEMHLNVDSQTLASRVSHNRAPHAMSFGPRQTIRFSCCYRLHSLRGASSRA